MCAAASPGTEPRCPETASPPAAPNVVCIRLQAEKHSREHECGSSPVDCRDVRGIIEGHRSGVASCSRGLGAESSAIGCQAWPCEERAVTKMGQTAFCMFRLPIASSPAFG